ncbi:MAG: TetR/AcrR family transcriptional regulator [Bacteroidota bacterium]
MFNERTLPWILTGYRMFAQKGPAALKIEVIAREVGKSKSSFYHHFADLEVFREFLLAHHLERAEIIAERERACKTLVPELLEVLVDVKEDLLFNRQLRFNRDNPRFKSCFEKSTQAVGDGILRIWAEALDLGDNSYLAQLVLNLTLENFYLQITEENLTYDWLETYVTELKTMVQAFKNHEHAGGLG